MQARKQLANALPLGLASMGYQISRERTIAALAHAGVAPQQRAETVSLAQWALIYAALHAD